jgi:hypothetical protein
MSDNHYRDENCEGKARTAFRRNSAGSREPVCLSVEVEQPVSGASANPSWLFPLRVDVSVFCIPSAIRDLRAQREVL